MEEFKITITSLEKILGQNFQQFNDEISADFFKQVLWDFDQVKAKLEIESRYDSKIYPLCFAYKCGAVKGILKMIKLIKEKKLDFSVIDKIPMNSK